MKKIWLNAVISLAAVGVCYTWCNRKIQVALDKSIEDSAWLLNHTEVVWEPIQTADGDTSYTVVWDETSTKMYDVLTVLLADDLSRSNNRKKTIDKWLESEEFCQLVKDGYDGWCSYPLADIMSEGELKYMYSKLK